jgi:hypothetical protein
MTFFFCWVLVNVLHASPFSFQTIIFSQSLHLIIFNTPCHLFVFPSAFSPLPLSSCLVDHLLSIDLFDDPKFDCVSCDLNKEAPEVSVSFSLSCLLSLE